MKQISKKVFAATAAAAFALGGVSVAIYDNVTTPEPIVPAPEVKIVEVNNTIYKEVPVNVTVTETIEVEDLAFKTLACNKLMFEDVSECVEEVEAEDVALVLAIEAIEKDYADELEDAEIVKDEDEARLIKVYSDFEDVEVVKSDFDDEKYKFVISAKVEDEDKEKKFKVDFTVEVEDSEVKILKVEKQ